MSRRTRLFLLISAGVLVAGLGAGLVASYMGAGLQSFNISSGGPAELEYVPQDSSLVAFANVRDVMDSELCQKLLQVRPDGQDPTADFEARTGISVERDIDLVVASLGRGGEQDHPMVIARGRFDEPRIEGVVREQGGSVAEYRGARLLTVTGGDHATAVAFPEAGLALVGAPDAVRRALDTKAGAAANITTNAEVMNLVRDIDNGNAWAVGRFDTLSRRGRVPSELAGQLPPINWFAASGRINGGVEGLVRAEANSDEAAADLREVVRGFMALARLQTGRNPQLAALLDSLQLAGEGRTVSVAFAVPAEVVDAFVAMRRDPPDAVQP
jgi:hypothetical protein